MLVDFKWKFKAFWESRISLTFGKSEVSSAKILSMEVIPSGKSFTYIENKSGPNNDPCGTSEFIFFQSQVRPFKTTVSCLFLIKKLIHLQHHKTLIWIVDLYTILYQILWKYLKKHLSHQQEDYYQNWFVFHEWWSEVELHTNHLEDNQVAKVKKVYYG